MIKKHLLTVFLLTVISEACYSQKLPDNFISRNRHLVEAGAIVPVGALAESHRVGVGLDYSLRLFTLKRRNPKADTVVFTNLSGAQPGLVNQSAQGKAKFTILITAGANYLFGRKVKTAGYDFHFQNVLDVHFLAGLQYRAAPLLCFTIATGPAGLKTKEEFIFGWAANLTARYQVSERISVGPDLQYRYQKSVEDWYAFGLKAAYSF